MHDPLKIIPGQLKSFGFMDTCGIFNLHGIPGIIAFICGAISITTYDSELTNLPFALNSLDVRREHLNPSLM
jgi:ammonia channel protein AmtB